MSRHSGPEYVAPDDRRCEALVKGGKYVFDWMRRNHRCPRTANQSRAGRAVCHQHARQASVVWWETSEEAQREEAQRSRTKMMITELNHFNIATDDLEKSARFYEKLGLRIGPRPDFGNTGVWMYIGPNPKVHLNLASEVGPVHDGKSCVHHLGFDVLGSLEDVCGMLGKIGIEYRIWPTAVPGWYRALYFSGPSGEEIEFVLKDCYVPHRGEAMALADSD